MFAASVSSRMVLACFVTSMEGISEPCIFGALAARMSLFRLLAKKCLFPDPISPVYLGSPNWSVY